MSIPPLFWQDVLSTTTLHVTKQLGKHEPPARRVFCGKFPERNGTERAAAALPLLGWWWGPLHLPLRKGRYPPRNSKGVLAGHLFSGSCSCCNRGSERKEVRNELFLNLAPAAESWACTSGGAAAVPAVRLLIPAGLSPLTAASSSWFWALARLWWSDHLP